VSLLVQWIAFDFSLLLNTITRSAFDFSLLINTNTIIDWAPEIESVSAPVLAETGQTYRPTVVVHGMGDSGTNSGMKSLCKTVSDKYPGSFVLCSTTADGGASISNKMQKQLADFATEVHSHPELKNGFNAVGLSQGNFIVEAYIALINDPPVYNFVSICGPLQGEATCPKNIAFDAICPIWKLDPYGAPLAFSGYWKNTKDEAGFAKKSQMLADVLNARDTKNATTTANWLKTNTLLVVEATKDTMIEPKESELFGMWKWGTEGRKAPIVAMRDSEGYKGDWIGLKTLDQAGKLKNASFVGEHIRFSNEFWDENVLPLLGNYLPNSTSVSH
jgi:palmitoyl-protein thioesterase